MVIEFEKCGQSGHWSVFLYSGKWHESRGRGKKGETQGGVEEAKRGRKKNERGFKRTREREGRKKREKKRKNDSF